MILNSCENNCLKDMKNIEMIKKKCLILAKQKLNKMNLLLIMLKAKSPFVSVPMQQILRS